MVGSCINKIIDWSLDMCSIKRGPTEQSPRTLSSTNQKSKITQIAAAKCNDVI